MVVSVVPEVRPSTKLIKLGLITEVKLNKNDSAILATSGVQPPIVFCNTIILSISIEFDNVPPEPVPVPLNATLGVAMSVPPTQVGDDESNKMAGCVESVLTIRMLSELYCVVISVPADKGRPTASTSKDSV